MSTLTVMTDSIRSAGGGATSQNKRPIIVDIGADPIIQWISQPIAIDDPSYNNVLCLDIATNNNNIIDALQNIIIVPSIKQQSSAVVPTLWVTFCRRQVTTSTTYYYTAIWYEQQ